MDPEHSQIGPNPERGAFPLPAPEPDAKLAAKGSLSSPISLVELRFNGADFSNTSQHVAVIASLVQVGSKVRRESYAKYYRHPLVVDIPTAENHTRIDVRFCGYGWDEYSVEHGSIFVRSLLLIGITFQVIEFSYDAVSKYPSFKEGFKLEKFI